MEITARPQNFVVGMSSAQVFKKFWRCSVVLCVELFMPKFYFSINRFLWGRLMVLKSTKKSSVVRVVVGATSAVCRSMSLLRFSVLCGKMRNPKFYFFVCGFLHMVKVVYRCGFWICQFFALVRVVCWMFCSFTRFFDVVSLYCLSIISVTWNADWFLLFLGWKEESAS